MCDEEVNSVASSLDKVGHVAREMWSRRSTPAWLTSLVRLPSGMPDTDARLIVLEDSYTMEAVSITRCYRLNGNASAISVRSCSDRRGALKAECSVVEDASRLWIGPQMSFFDADAYGRSTSGMSMLLKFRLSPFRRHIFSRKRWVVEDVSFSADITAVKACVRSILSDTWWL